MPQDECKSKIESESNANMVKKCQHLFKKQDVHCAIDVIIGVDNDVAVQQHIQDETVSEILMENMENLAMM
jgi:hypothetical protein